MIEKQVASVPEFCPSSNLSTVSLIWFEADGSANVSEWRQNVGGSSTGGLSLGYQADRWVLAGRIVLECTSKAAQSEYPFGLFNIAFK